MVPETYTDGIGWIGLSEGMIRIDFVTFMPTADAESPQPTSESRHRLIMTLQTFLQSVVTQQHVIAKLQSAGHLKILSDRTLAEPSVDTTAADHTTVRPRSPNFHRE